MNHKINFMSRRYAAALEKHLRQGHGASLQPALRVGHKAAALGLEMLELARIHEGAVLGLAASDRDRAKIRRAEYFFSKAITPIVETHRAARRSKTDLRRLHETLKRRTTELAVTNLQLQKGVVRRKRVEAALKRSGEHYARLLKDSLQLQGRLRQLAHQVLAAQEAERKKLSRELQDEIAQTLLGINVRLISLKREARTNSAGLKNEIAGTQRLVAKSARSVRRVAQEFKNA